MIDIESPEAPNFDLARVVPRDPLTGQTIPVPKPGEEICIWNGTQPELAANDPETQGTAEPTERRYDLYTGEEILLALARHAAMLLIARNPWLLVHTPEGRQIVANPLPIFTAEEARQALAAADVMGNGGLRVKQIAGMAIGAVIIPGERPATHAYNQEYGIGEDERALNLLDAKFADILPYPEEPDEVSCDSVTTALETTEAAEIESAESLADAIRAAYRDDTDFNENNGKLWYGKLDKARLLVAGQNAICEHLESIGALPEGAHPITIEEAETLLSNRGLRRKGAVIAEAGGIPLAWFNPRGESVNVLGQYSPDVVYEQPGFVGRIISRAATHIDEVAEFVHPLSQGSAFEVSYNEIHEAFEEQLHRIFGPVLPEEQVRREIYRLLYFSEQGKHLEVYRFLEDVEGSEPDLNPRQWVAMMRADDMADLFNPRNGSTESTPKAENQVAPRKRQSGKKKRQTQYAPNEQLTPSWIL